MEIYGNPTTFNFEIVLRENIVSHEYMRRTARSMTSWGEVIDELYGHVDHVEPWMSGNVRGPSTAFCLLYRLMELRLDEEQIRETVGHKDSPYIRAIGFLYLRYVCDPKELWTWFEPYVTDRERPVLAQKFWPSGDGIGKEVTMGEYVRDLLLCQFYFQTIFTRIPKKVSDVIVEQLTAMKLPTVAKGNGGQGGPDRRGVDEGRARPASVKASLSVSLGPRSTSRAAPRDEASDRPKRDSMRPSAHSHERERHPSGHDADHGRRDDWRERDRERERDVHRDRGASERSRDRDWGSRRGSHAAYSRGGGGRDGMREPSPRGDWRRDGSAGRHSAHSSRHRDRDRSRTDAPPVSAVFGRSAADVFGKSAAPVVASDSLRSSYGEYRATDGLGGGRLDKTEEVFRIGGRSR